MGKRKTASAWRVFLGALARTGNARAAAAEAGMDVGTAYDRRIKDQGFAARWEAALAKAKARPSPRPSPHSGRGRRPELVLRRTSHGDKLVRAGPGRWNAKAEAVFLAELRRTGCVRWAAAACGFSTNALYNRRGNYPDFAARWAAAEAEARERIPALLSAATIASLDPEVEDADLPRVNVDQAIAISRLKGGGEDRGRRGNRGGISSRKPEMSREELQEDLIKKLDILDRRHRQKRSAEGWTETEEGHMIPPGWVRAGREGGGESG